MSSGRRPWKPPSGGRPPSPACRCWSPRTASPPTTTPSASTSSAGPWTACWTAWPTGWTCAATPTGACSTTSSGPTGTGPGSAWSRSTGPPRSAPPSPAPPGWARSPGPTGSARRSDGRPAAVRRQDGPVDVAGVVAQQPADGGGQLLGGGHRGDGGLHDRSQDAGGVLGPERRLDVGGHRAGGDGVGPDPGALVEDRGALGEAVHRVLGGGVGHPGGRGAQAGLGGDID